jgi:hypothetical protein
VAKELRVTVVGDTKQYAAALKGAAGATSSFGSTLKGIGKTAALVTGAAGIGGLALTLKVWGSASGRSRRRWPRRRRPC